MVPPAEPTDEVIVAREDLAHSLRSRFDAVAIDTLTSASNKTREDRVEEWIDGQ